LARPAHLPHAQRMRSVCGGVAGSHLWLALPTCPVLAAHVGRTVSRRSKRASEHPKQGPMPTDILVPGLDILVPGLDILVPGCILEHSNRFGMPTWPIHTALWKVWVPRKLCAWHAALRCQYLFLCTSKASKLGTWNAKRRRPARQYLYFCAIKASNWGGHLERKEAAPCANCGCQTCKPYIPHRPHIRQARDPPWHVCFFLAPFF